MLLDTVAEIPKSFIMFNYILIRNKNFLFFSFAAVACIIAGYEPIRLCSGFILSDCPSAVSSGRSNRKESKDEKAVEKPD